MDTIVDRRLKKKTPLAALRAMLTEEKEKTGRWSNRKQEYKKKKLQVRLSADTVAKWLGCSKQNVTDIECAKVLRKKLKNGRVREIPRRLSFSQAELFSNQTAANIGYLLGNNPANPIDWYGNPYTQAAFDQRQAELKRRKQDRAFAAHLLQINLAKGTAILAAGLLRAFQEGKDDIVPLKMIEALKSVYGDVYDDPMDANGLLRSYLAGRHKTTRPDLKPILDTWQAHFQEMLAQRPQPTAQPARPRRQGPTVLPSAHLMEAAKPKPARR
jgi:hypothetical protein